VLAGGLKYCNGGAPETTGFIASGEECLDFEISISASIHDGDPPWDQHMVKYPPPETMMSQWDADRDPNTYSDQVVCLDWHNSYGWNWDEANSTIDEYCNSDQAFKGYFGSNYKVERNYIRLSAWAGNGARPVYSDAGWCE
jgi:hypothetical protein